MQSEIFSLAKSDYVKGLVVAILGAVLVSVQSAFVHGGINAIDWGFVLNVAIGAGLAYLAKNWATDSNGRVLGLFGGK